MAAFAFFVTAAPADRALGRLMLARFNRNDFESEAGMVCHCPAARARLRNLVRESLLGCLQIGNVALHLSETSGQLIHTLPELEDRGRSRRYHKTMDGGCLKVFPTLLRLLSGPRGCTGWSCSDGLRARALTRLRSSRKPHATLPRLVY
jgi:hypothetical protein